VAEIKTKVNKASVTKFLGAIKDDQVRKDCKRIAVIMAKATGKKAEMWGTNIVGFGRMTYHGKSRSVEWMEAAFAPRKGVITLYLMAGFTGFDELLKRLGKHSRGKGCLYLKRLSDVDEATLNKLVIASVKQVRMRGELS
jgi:hypothetical protein